MMKYRHFFFHLVSVLGFSLVIVACSQTTPSPSVATATPSISISPTAPSPSPTSPPTLIPTLKAPPLGAVPQTCSPGPTPQNIFGGLGPVIGKSPIWATGFTGPNARILIPSYNTYTKFGWTWKILWDVGPHFLQQITIQGKDMQSGTPLHFQFADTDPIVTSLVLDPNHPTHSGAGAGPNYKEWGSYIYIQKAGCYQIKATWQGGQWSFPFAAGHQ
jgi:hypothetical protein